MSDADDSTFCVCDTESVKNVFRIISEFSVFAGSKLNVTKIKGMCLGPLKDLGLCKCCDGQENATTKMQRDNGENQVNMARYKKFSIIALIQGKNLK